MDAQAQSIEGTGPIRYVGPDVTLNFSGGRLWTVLYARRTSERESRPTLAETLGRGAALACCAFARSTGGDCDLFVCSPEDEPDPARGTPPVPEAWLVLESDPDQPGGVYVCPGGASGWRETASGIAAVAVAGLARAALAPGWTTALDPSWTARRREHLNGHPECAACGSRGYLEVHRVSGQPDCPELITLCEHPDHNCHLIFGHLLDATKVRRNPRVREMAAAFRAALAAGV